MHTARSFIQEGSHVFRPVCRLVYRELKTMPRFTKVWKMSRCLNLETASLSSNLSKVPSRVGVVGGCYGF